MYVCVYAFHTYSLMGGGVSSKIYFVYYLPDCAEMLYTCVFVFSFLYLFSNYELKIVEMGALLKVNLNNFQLKMIVDF